MGFGRWIDALRALRRRGGRRPQLRQAQGRVSSRRSRAARCGARSTAPDAMGDADEPARAGAGRRAEPGPLQDGRLVRRRGGRPRRLLAGHPADRRSTRSARPELWPRVRRGGLDYLGGAAPDQRAVSIHQRDAVRHARTRSRSEQAYAACRADGRRGRQARLRRVPRAPGLHGPRRRTSSASTTTRSGASTRRSRTRWTRTGSSRPASRASGPRACGSCARVRTATTAPTARGPDPGGSYTSSMDGTDARAWLRCYRCWSQDLEVQVHYEGIHRIDPETGERAEVVDELQEAVVQCLDCMHDQPHLGFHNGRVEPIEDRWERMIAGTPWVASCTVTVDADEVETLLGPRGGRRALLRRLRRPRHARVLHPRALPQARGRPASSCTCSSSSTPARRGGDRGARVGGPRRADDHVAGRGVAPARGDRRSPLTPDVPRAHRRAEPFGRRCARPPRRRAVRVQPGPSAGARSARKAISSSSTSPARRHRSS